MTCDIWGLSWDGPNCQGLGQLGVARHLSLLSGVSGPLCGNSPWFLQHKSLRVAGLLIGSSGLQDTQVEAARPLLPQGAASHLGQPRFEGKGPHSPVEGMSKNLWPPLIHQRETYLFCRSSTLKNTSILGK